MGQPGTETGAASFLFLSVKHNNVRRMPALSASFFPRACSMIYRKFSNTWMAAVGALLMGLTTLVQGEPQRSYLSG